MNCPIAHATLVDYFSRSLSDEEGVAVDEHLFSCDGCFQAAQPIAALADALRTAIPPVVVQHDLELAKARGVIVDTNDFMPGQAKEAWMKHGVDLLIHRLILEDAEAFEHAYIEFETLDGAPLLKFPDSPIDRASGAVLISCQRHFADLFPEPNMRIRVRATGPTGLEATASYTVLHRYE